MWTSARLGEGSAAQAPRRPSGAPGGRRRWTASPAASCMWCCPRAGRATSTARTWPGPRPARALEVGDLVFVEPHEGGTVYDLRQTPIVNGALVAIEPHTGRVLAMVGGYSFSPVQLQPRHPGDAPAGLGVQAVRLRHRAGERLHPRLHRARTRRSACRAPTARPGRRRTSSTTSPARSPSATAWSIRATR